MFIWKNDALVQGVGCCNVLLLLSRLQHLLTVSSLSAPLLLLTQARRNLHCGRRLMGSALPVVHRGYKLDCHKSLQIKEI